MECQDFHAFSHAYALGALRLEEERQCEAHLAEPGPHEACAEALEKAHRTVAWLGEALVPVHPGEHVWRHVSVRLGIHDEGRQPMRRREQVAWALALAALLTAAFLWPQVRDLQDDVANRRAGAAALRGELVQARQARDRGRKALSLLEAETLLLRQSLTAAQQAGPPWLVEPALPWLVEPALPRSTGFALPWFAESALPWFAGPAVPGQPQRLVSETRPPGAKAPVVPAPRSTP